ncbi:DEAD/DEAH box helicase family protein [Alteribacillus iranensis]|uniref:Superfamily II DNA or RNA helicase n=1 Tax=Alteribacillus iranensis TaxID=930128 RepID=A0A1I2FJF6_9BACI|nr:DEAD/DEAH box helicase family protein [Alteribacillus iranensis]SFF05572.1 Superfamily II DNA or RNA helicase [Alteribacillus iranensis]
MSESIKLITSQLYQELQPRLARASSIYILSSFIMRSGVKLLHHTLSEAAERGADVKVLGGDYLYVTQPDALRDLLCVHPNMEVRLKQSAGISFHPKALLLKEDQEGQLIVGSSNLSRSAWTEGTEWNLAVEREAAVTLHTEAIEEFMRLFYASDTIPVNKETIKIYEEEYTAFHRDHPSLAASWSQVEETGLMLPLRETEFTYVKEETRAYSDKKITPRFAQSEALESLEEMKQEGYRKAMVVMATGLGKTYLAAFFAKNFKNILFVAHREEILNQAASSFQQVHPNRTTGMFYAQKKEPEADSVFASVFTLSMKENLEQFSPAQFDLIIMDEFHHAAAATYQKVLEYFEPKFLLGITATPHRMDNKDVYAICDGNVAYEMDFLTAIRRGWLSPFVYHGVYDDTDYSSLRWIGNHYDPDQLAQLQLREDHAKHIFKTWNTHRQSRTLCFCSSIRQAEFLLSYFQKQGIKKAAAVHSQSIVGRKEAVEALSRGDLEIIFTVDLFNEGVDIPAVDTLLFVRPTESLTIFTQQIGRGLRLAEGKEYCTIIDLIGNYRNADVKLSLFDTEGRDMTKPGHYPAIPEVCDLHLDTKVIDLLDVMRRKRSPRKDQLRYEYFLLKQELGRRPSYLEAVMQTSVGETEYKRTYGGYYGFLHSVDELDDHEEEVYLSNKSLLEEVEKTGMTKAYKMVLFDIMLARGEKDMLAPIRPEEAAKAFHHFYMEKEFRRNIDFSDRATKQLWIYDEKRTADLIARMPMTKWAGSSKGMFQFDGEFFSPNIEVKAKHSAALHNMLKEIVDYRLTMYFRRKRKKEETST